MATASKTKGSKFERGIASALSDRFFHIYGVKNSFITNAGSGSRFGGQNSKRLDATHDRHHLVGDITPPDTNFKFVIECKHYKDPVTFMSVVKQSIGQWDGWINQVETDAVSSGKLPMLVIKYNLVPEVVIFRKSTEIGIEPLLTYKEYKLYTWSDILKLADEFFIAKGEK